ncbi:MULTISPECIES: hypothetical protein [unclassified Bartonella]|uniref:hypothetical protein n=1 Tax=unclassified Bartonella TaxID=2645622 RepID=UPI00099AF56F|nr:MULTISPECIES: hypothetical protein [unclassified Bartonella]AQX28272.1 ribose transport system ATP-binding protein [Bartonella sp. JB15]AQX29543.1 ribose transport system ATP-binding protein [Bartonella sp. JB63]
MVEIARALLFDADIIIMDKPTALLSQVETESLFSVIRALAAEEKAIVYISHRLNEIFEFCHDISVLRDGKMLFTGKASMLDEKTLIRHMVRCDIQDQYSHIEVKKGESLLAVKDLIADAEVFNLLLLP